MTNYKIFICIIVGIAALINIRMLIKYFKNGEIGSHDVDELNE